MINNLTQDVHKKLPNWDKFVTKLKHFEALLNGAEHKRHLMRAIFKGAWRETLIQTLVRVREGSPQPSRSPGPRVATGDSGGGGGSLLRKINV